MFTHILHVTVPFARISTDMYYIRKIHIEHNRLPYLSCRDAKRRVGECFFIILLLWHKHKEVSVVYYGQTNQIENKINDTTCYCDAIYLEQKEKTFYDYTQTKIICGRNDDLWRTSALCILLYRQINWGDDKVNGQSQI